MCGVISTPDIEMISLVLRWVGLVMERNGLVWRVLIVAINRIKVSQQIIPEEIFSIYFFKLERPLPSAATTPSHLSSIASAMTFFHKKPF